MEPGIAGRSGPPERLGWPSPRSASGVETVGGDPLGRRLARFGLGHLDSAPGRGIGQETRASIPANAPPGGSIARHLGQVAGRRVRGPETSIRQRPGEGMGRDVGSAGHGVGLVAGTGISFGPPWSVPRPVRRRRCRGRSSLAIGRGLSGAVWNRSR